MAQLSDGAGGGTKLSIDALFKALRSSSRPIDTTNLGAYRLAVTTGTIAAALAASAQLFYMRWTDATRFLVLLNLEARFQCLTLFTAATLTDFGFDLHKATAVSAGGGGTQVLGSGVSKLRTSGMNNSLLGDARIATTAALTALTTLDANPIEQSVGDSQRVNPAGGTEEQIVHDPTLIYRPDIANGEHPLVLAQNEGIVVRNRAVWPAAGTGILQVRATWAEVAAY